MRGPVSTTKPVAIAAAAALAIAITVAARTATAAPGAQRPAGDDLDLGARVNRALERARPALVRYLKKTRGDALALVCLAARHDGMGSADPEFAQAVDRLARLETANTYALALRLMVVAELPDFPDREAVAERDLARLLQHQAGGGGFSYHPNDGWWDLSNTQYAALGMRAARSMGLAIPRATWRLLLMDVLAAQHEHGGFTYRPGQGRGQAYASMTVAGIAVLEICRQALDLDDAKDAEVAAAIERAWQWMAEHAGDIGDRRTLHCLYFHYGLERAAILSQRDRVGDVDWYAAGAGMMLKMQRRNGEFRSQKDVRMLGNTISTGFAVLFLRRKFQRVLDGPTTPATTYTCRGLPARADGAQVRAAVSHDVARGGRAVPDLLAAMRDPLEVRRRAAAMALIRISGRDFRFHPGRTPEQNAAALLRAERWWREEQGGAGGGDGSAGDGSGSDGSGSDGSGSDGHDGSERRAGGRKHGTE